MLTSVTTLVFLVFASPSGGVIVAAFDSQADCDEVADTIRPHLTGGALVYCTVEA